MFFTQMKKDTANKNRERCFPHARKLIRPIKGPSSA